MASQRVRHTLVTEQQRRQQFSNSHWKTVRIQLSYEWVLFQLFGWTRIKSKRWGDFPDCTAVKILHSHCRGTGLIPGQGTKNPHATWCCQKKKRERDIHSFKKEKTRLLAHTYTIPSVSCILLLARWRSTAVIAKSWIHEPHSLGLNPDCALTSWLWTRSTPWFTLLYSGDSNRIYFTELLWKLNKLVISHKALGTLHVGAQRKETKIAWLCTYSEKINL